ncbi:hypothetical protein NHX12_026334 [Muraenolepis orangiensis]|uniref:CSC1/OSCA1-like 7TM region domain-containing protein n=1 Tax=Muraenolepis orangiensis TaxID=630683 RepID=A0A9Q0EK22_9TELE|nr:hypothetical protein NHX12_026334 [Muraenolepis orangiensis]
MKQDMLSEDNQEAPAAMEISHALLQQASPRSVRTGPIKTGGRVFVLDHTRWTPPMKEAIDGLLRKYHGEKDKLKHVDRDYADLVHRVVMSPLWWDSDLWQEANSFQAPAHTNSCHTTKQSLLLKDVKFGGLPVVLQLYLGVFLILVLLFSAIRKKLWDYGRLALVSDSKGINVSARRRFGRMASSVDEPETETGCCSWLPFVIAMDSEKVKARCGMDAVHYLSFQRHLIFLLTMVTVCSLTIFLPVNLSGELLGNEPFDFGRTTIGNLRKGNKLLWLHTVFAVLYLILTVAVLRHYTEAYPSCQVTTVTLGYDVAKLMQLDKERMRAQTNLRYYQKDLAETGRREVINPRLCGYLGCCACCKCEKVDAIEYYSNQEAALLTEPWPNTFSKTSMPLTAGAGKAWSAALTASLRVKRWRVGFAPHPLNIYWENLSVQGVRWGFNITKPISYLNSAVISQFFPTLLLWCFSSLLPTVVFYATLAEAHWSRSSEQLSMMHKLYIFLLFMVLILPSLGLTSLAVFIRWLFDQHFLIEGKLRFECVFLPDQGAFFVNYVIAAALLGSGMDLLRLPGLLLYTIRMMLARSAAERKYVKQNQAYSFEYGAMYSRMLCVFTVVMSYSITCPMITPFGLLYLILKHLVDKHNLYFTNLPTHVDRQVHLAAVSQALAAPIICLIWLYFFSVLRMGFMADTSLFTFVVLCITVVIFVGYNCFGNFKYLSPHNYLVSVCVYERVCVCVRACVCVQVCASMHTNRLPLFVVQVIEEDDEKDGNSDLTMAYLPRVLSTEAPEEAQSPQCYGSTESSPVHAASPVDNSLLMA